MNENKLDIGCGQSFEDGWTPHDIKNGDDARSLRGYADGTVAGIRASHVLEHIPMAQTIPTLREWHRALALGGRLFVSVPDADLIMNCMQIGFPDNNLERYLFGGQIDGDDFHFAMFWESKLASLLAGVGFQFAQRCNPEGNNTSQHWVSLNMEAYKAR